MRRRPYGFVFILLLAVLLLVMPVWQFSDWLKIRGDSERTTVLLYQVTAFQMELLGSSVNEAGRVTTTEALNEWKRAVFAAMYAHERLADAVGSGMPGKLDSLDMLMQWILRVQVGGERPLSKEESELAAGVAESFKPLLEAYSGLIDGEGKLDGTNSGKLKKADAELAELVRKKLK